jgi:hypothetical protein
MNVYWRPFLGGITPSTRAVFAQKFSEEFNDHVAVHEVEKARQIHLTQHPEEGWEGELEDLQQGLVERCEWFSAQLEPQGLYINCFGCRRCRPNPELPTEFTQLVVWKRGTSIRRRSVDPKTGLDRGSKRVKVQNLVSRVCTK